MLTDNCISYQEMLHDCLGATYAAHRVLIAGHTLRPYAQLVEEAADNGW